MTEWLANLSITYVLIAVAVLFVVRLVLSKYEGPMAKSATETVESVMIAVILVFLIIRPFVVQAFFIPSESMLPTLQVRDHILVNKFIYRFQEPRHGDIVVFKAPPKASDDHMAQIEEDPRSQWNSDAVWRQEFNLVVGEIVSPQGDSGEVLVELHKYPREDLERLRYVCTISEGDRRILAVESMDIRGDSPVMKFAGIDSAADAEELTGAEIRLSEKDYIKRLIGLPGDTIAVMDGSLYRNGQKLDEPYLNESNIYYELEPFEVREGELFVMGDNRNNSNDSHEWGTLDRNRMLGKAMVRFWPLNRIGLVR